MKGLILTYLITFAGSIAALRYPLIGLHVYVGLAVVRPQFIFNFAGDLSGLSFMVGVAVLIGWALKGFGDWRFERARPVVIALLGFVGLYGVAGLLAQHPEHSLVPVRELWKVTLPFLVGITLMKGEKDWRPMLWTIVLAQGYVGLEQNMNYLLKGYNSAAEGFGGMDNNFFGVSLVTVIGPAVALMISSRTWLGRGLAGAAAALILHTLFLTFSRGGMVGLLAVGLVTFVMMPKRPKFIGALVLTALFAVRFVGPELAARYNTTFASAEERDGSAASRVDLWRDTVRVMGENPWFGIGPGNWRVAASSFGWTEGKSAHSIWMETAAEAGIPAALVLMLFFGSTAVKLWPIARERQTESNRYEVILASGVILAIVGFSVSGQFVSVPTLEAPYYVTMLGIAMLKTRARQTAPDVVPSVAAVPSPYAFQPPPRLRPITESSPRRN